MILGKTFILIFQEERCSYETAAKEALKKLHDERLEAIAAAADEQRSRAAAEQECVLVKEQLSQAQTEIQVLHISSLKYFNYLSILFIGHCTKNV